MFGPGQPLDIRRYYVVAPDHLGAGGSGKPSDGLRMAFPAYEHGDVVAAHHRLLTECLGITHLRLAIGTSYGGRLCWQWAVDHPQFLDGIVPLAATPYPLVGRRGMQDFLGIEPLLRDPTWNGGNYTEPPNNFPMALMGFWAWVFGSGHLWDRAPTREKAWTYLPHVVTKLAGELDANDWIYQLRVNDTYDLRDRLARIQARVLFLEMAGDEIVPRELGATEQVLATLGDRAEHLRVAEAEHYGHAGVAKTLPLYAPRIAAFLKSLEPQPGT
jgi:homoserine O-acetyltransferase